MFSIEKDDTFPNWLALGEFHDPLDNYVEFFSYVDYKLVLGNVIHFQGLLVGKNYDIDVDSHSAITDPSYYNFTGHDAAGDHFNGAIKNIGTKDHPRLDFSLETDSPSGDQIFNLHHDMFYHI